MHDFGVWGVHIHCYRLVFSTVRNKRNDSRYLCTFALLSILSYSNRPTRDYPTLLASAHPTHP